jgi:hydrogenase expression/formation protein HypD
MFSLRDKQLAMQIVTKIKQLDVNLKFMHVCGTHQDTLVKNGMDVLFRECGIHIGQGPGCPVCVTTPKEIEEMLLLAKKGKIIATFGDMIQVPGEIDSLLTIKTEGHTVKTVYSIEDAVTLAEHNKDKEVIFMAVGFETTAPATASVLRKDLPANFSVLSCHRIIPPALQAILDMGEVKLDGFIEPGHVSTIIGMNPYEFISKEYNIPQVIAGFEPLDLLMAVWMLVHQIQQGKAIVENEYTRAVKREGNVKAQQTMASVFCIADVKWRGFPIIPKSGLEIQDKYDSYNARKKYEDELEELKDKEFSEPVGCKCGEVLRGIVSSQECPLFGTKCKPNSPVGPCMVSIEGSCNIEYRYIKNS